MPIPPLPFRSFRNDDAGSGRREGVQAASGTETSARTGDADAAFATAFPDHRLSPAVVAADGRGPVMLLSDARERASRVASGLEQVGSAGDGLGRVQVLVGHLRDVAVVALDRSLAPADRATLQRQVDQTITEIDTIADRTLVDDRLLHASTTARATASAEEPTPTPFRAIGTVTLGIAGLAVRSADQAFAASGALDVATARLERTAGTLTSATARLQDMMDQLTNPTTTVTGEAAIGSSAAALNVTVAINAQILTDPEEAVQAQGMLDVDRIKWLLDSPFR